MKIYISGRITGEDNYKESFNEAERQFKMKGYEVVNPVNLPHNHDLSWESYMKEDIKALMDCDAIFMLKNWHQSKGAIIEKTLACELNMKVINEI